MLLRNGHKCAHSIATGGGCVWFSSFDMRIHCGSRYENSLLF